MNDKQVYSSLLKQRANCIPRSKSSERSAQSARVAHVLLKKDPCAKHTKNHTPRFNNNKKKTAREVRKQQLNSPFLQKTLREMDQNILTRIKAYSAGEPRRNKLIYFLPSLATFIKNFILGENLSRIICSKLQLLRTFIE